MGISFLNTSPHQDTIPEHSNMHQKVMEMTFPNASRESFLNTPPMHQEVNRNDIPKHSNMHQEVIPQITFPNTSPMHQEVNERSFRQSTMQQEVIFESSNMHREIKKMSPRTLQYASRGHGNAIPEHFFHASKG
jgi:hypothetical protein